MSAYSKLIRAAIGDGARSNKFNVIFSFQSSGGFEKELAISCKSSSYPDIKAKTADFKYKGHIIPIYISSVYGNDWDAEFYMDPTHKLKRFFDSWVEFYDGRGEGITMRDVGARQGTIFLPNGEPLFPNLDNKGDLTVTARIYQFDFDAEITPETTDGATAKYVLYNVFPSGIDKISVGENDDFLTLKVNFKYSYFERED